MSELSYALSRYLVDCNPAQIESLGCAGGMSGARFWRFAGSQGPLVLRRWPPEHPTPERLRFIHGVLQLAAKRGVSFLPLPIATRDGQTFVIHGDHLWELAPWLPGVADYEQAPSPVKLQAALVALAQFHNATADCPLRADLGVGRQAESPANTLSTGSRPCPAIARRLARLGELQSGGLSRLTRAISDATWPELARLARSLVELVPPAATLAANLLTPLAQVSLPQQPCLRDVWHDHVLFVGDEVTGLIDFGAIDIDTPATDVARLLGSLVGDDAADWHRGLAAYATIRPLAPDEIRAAAALDASGTVLAGCNWIRWVYVEHRRFENLGQVQRRLEQLLDRLRQLVCRKAPVIGPGP